MAGHHINEALIAQLQASDQWAYYQAKGIKAGTLTAKIDLLKAMGKEPDGKDVEKAADYNKNQDEIKEKATDFEHERTQHIEHHEGLARSVTMFQVCIAIAAVAVLTNRRRFWWVSLVFGAAGIYFMIVGLYFNTPSAAGRPPPQRDRAGRPVPGEFREGGECRRPAFAAYFVKTCLVV